MCESVVCVCMCMCVKVTAQCNETQVGCCERYLYRGSTTPTNTNTTTTDKEYPNITPSSPKRLLLLLLFWSLYFSLLLLLFTITKHSEDYTRSTLRQTQVLVIPANADLNDSFAVFDRLIHVINEARRNARDYVTDYSLEKLDDRMYDSDNGSGNGAVDRDWV